MKHRALPVVALVALAALAGCATAPVQQPSDATATPAASPTDEPSTPQADRVTVSELGATLEGVNATEVWHRVGTIVDVELPSPPDVVVRTRDPGYSHTPSEFRQSMGAERYAGSTDIPAGRYDPSGTVVIKRTPNSTAAEIESVLAHEFAHALQYEHLKPQFPHGDGLAEQTVIEGSAEYVEWRYAAEYGSYDSEQRYQRSHSEGAEIGKLFNAPYSQGAQWVRNHSDPDAPLESAFERHPTTAEQVLHGLAPGSEPPRPLAADGESGATGLFVTGERRGEAELRFLLEYGLSSQRAERAAAGWGDDRRLWFSNDSGNGYAWAVRWDSPDEAREFEALFADYRANASEPLALRSVGDETTVVLSGREAFVRNATVSGTAGNVTVAAGD